jgi:DNA polymerase-3 subunit gamma/tau
MQAFNALLKTLEEPPAHVVFILATTEPQMLPATIVSRCQRFEFHRLKVADMVGSMKASLASIGAHIDEEGLIAIARAAEGGMRDCLSIADQCLSFCGGAVSADDVMSVLGSMNADFLFGIAKHIIDSDAAGVLRSVGEVVASGRDLGVFALDLASHFRALLLTKIIGDCRDILDCTGERMESYRKQAEEISKERAERAVEELLKLQLDLKLVSTPRTLVESTLLRICRPEDEKSVIALSDRVYELEHSLKNVAKEAAEAASRAAASMPKAQAAAAEKAETPAVTEEPDQYEAPPLTADADELYEKFLEALREDDETLVVSFGMSKAHWVSEGVLHICFDSSSLALYNYVSNPDSHAKLISAAKRAIAPHTVEVEMKRGNIRQSFVKELFGVPIIEK